MLMKEKQTSRQCSQIKYSSLFLPHQQILPKFIASQPCQTFGHISPTEFFQRCLFAKLHFRPVDCVSSASICLFLLGSQLFLHKVIFLWACLWGNPRDTWPLTGSGAQTRTSLVKSLTGFWKISVAASQMAPDEEHHLLRMMALCRLKPLLQALSPVATMGVYTLRHWGDTQLSRGESHMGYMSSRLVSHSATEACARWSPRLSWLCGSSSLEQVPN